MNTYKIAEIKVKMKTERKTLMKQANGYIVDETKAADITINICDEFVMEKQKENPHLSLDECEYIWTGSEFYNKLLEFNGFMLHSSAVAVENKAYLFSAKSGIGKSTHTELWQRYFGEDKALIINDDKPAIRFLNNRFYVYGTPWSGKSDKNLNLKVPLHSIIFIERSETNWIKKIDSKDAIKLILEQTLRPRNIEKMDKLLGLMKELLITIPIYKMGCNISEDAVKVAFNMMNEVT